ncbi:MAG: porphobilinogen synthase [Thermoplasmata archaeon]
MEGNEMLKRPRRLRYDENLRDMVKENSVDVNDLIYPMFVKQGSDIKKEIPSMPGNYHLSPDERLLEEVEKVVENGLKSVLLFGIPEDRDETGSMSRDDQGPVQKALRLLKDEFPDLYLITDVCLCAYTSHGHCGIVEGEKVKNDETLPYLAEMALSHVNNGADMVAPSDMMDGRVKAIREKLDGEGFKDIPIMSYSAKYASAFYGPFRDACESSPDFGDRRSHQMDHPNAHAAIREAFLDIEEGADIIMVKPALSYLDIIYRLREEVNVPIAAYSVSGEYSLIKKGGEAGLIDPESLFLEVMDSIKRAGADLIITYHALDLAKEL